MGTERKWVERKKRSEAASVRRLPVVVVVVVFFSRSHSLVQLPELPAGLLLLISSKGSRV